MEFLVIGGQAEYLFGSPRVTYDVDFCYRRTWVEPIGNYEALLDHAETYQLGAIQLRTISLEA